jgi:hypothetical protein
MAFQLFVDPTAGARSAADNIMKGAGAIADRLKEEKQRRKDESKLFKANVTKAAAMGLGKGETMAEAEADLSDNYTPETIQGLLEGTVAATQQQQREAAIASSKAQTAATKEGTRYQRETRSVRKGILSGQAAEMGAKLRMTESQIKSLNLSNEQKQNLLKYQDENLQLGIKQARENIKSSKSERRYKKDQVAIAQENLNIGKKRAKAYVNQVNKNIELTQQSIDQGDRKMGVMETNARTGLTNAQTSKLNAEIADREQKRKANLEEIDPGQLSPAHLSDGSLIPGIYLTQDGKVLQLDDPANEDPVQSELSALKGVLLKLEGDANQGIDPYPDDQYIDQDGSKLVSENLHPISWITAWMPWTAGEKTAGEWKREVRSKIAELEARQGPSGKARRYDPKAPKGQRLTQ